MSLQGELTDLSLAELIEFFCNQRKTGRLTVSYPHTHAYFYLQSGAVVHASVGSLRGIEAVYYALTQSNASFNFSTAYEPPDHTINQPWTSVVLEGLRRMDEGIEPRNPFGNNVEPAPLPVTVEAEAATVPLISQSPVSHSEPESPSAHIEPPPSIENKPVAPVHLVEPPRVVQSSFESESIVKREAPVKPKADVVIEKTIKPVPPAKEAVVSDAFLSSAHNASRFSTAPWKFGVVFAALILIVAGIAVPWGWRARGKAMKAAEQPAQLTEPAAQTQTPSTETAQTGADNISPAQSPDGTNAAPANDAADAARREREARAREEARLKAKAAAEANATSPVTPAQTAAPATQSAASGPKKAVVTVTYDENGRVTQASGSDPTALRIARQRRFPPGKPGSATLTIPIN
ncbi:MAG TPA: DUF4388 domain-containing protein [Pyrinomonadaceae bacterium]|jgi:hypothetical protein|nr:DUF4388 domain-containing protein [Pyrinomonadaceae bacterium]